MKTIFTFLISINSFFFYSQSIGLTSFASGFTSPVEIAHPTNDSRLFIVEQGGKIKILNPNGTTNATPFLTLTNTTISSGGERGLLGLAFHPNYASNGYFFVNYTNTAGNTVITRYTVSTNANIADTSSATIILTVNQPFNNHNGGSIKFGSDGFLYIGMGDGGSGGDPQNYAQNLTVNPANPSRVFLGKMLRIDVDSPIAGSLNYGVPPSNPYFSTAGIGEIWAIGLRNPWKFSFNRLNGDLWIADVGQNAFEEINRTKSPLPTNLNFGWRCYEGNVILNNTGCVPQSALTFPVAQYGHTNGACSITGGYEYTGSTYPSFIGNYFFADYCTNKIGILNIETLTYTWSPAFSRANFSTFGEDNAGELYIAGASNGIIYKITDTSLNVNTFNKTNFELYPNPATSEFFIKTKGIHFPASLSISDSTGKLLLNQSVDSNTNTIKTSTFQNGIYFVSIKDKKGASLSSKLIINTFKNN